MLTRFPPLLQATLLEGQAKSPPQWDPLWFAIGLEVLQYNVYYASLYLSSESRKVPGKHKGLCKPTLIDDDSDGGDGNGETKPNALGNGMDDSQFVNKLIIIKLPN